MNALFFSLLLGGAPLGEAVVLRTAENMYSAPSVAADVVSQAYLGQVVTLLETRDGFARVDDAGPVSGLAGAGRAACLPRGR